MKPENTYYAISDDYRIEISKHNHTLQYLHTTTATRDTADHKKGETYKTWTDAGHYQSLKYALKAFVLKFTGDAKNEADLLGKFERLEQLYFELGEM
jgi:hypothetical protein